MKKLIQFAALHQRLLILCCLGAALLFPLAAANAYVLRMGTVCLMYIMLSLGLNLLTGYMGQMSFGHAAFWGIGAYAAAIVVTRTPLGTIPAFIIAAVVVAALGFLLGLPVLKLKGYYLTIVTMGFCEIVRLVELNWVPVTRGPMGITGIPPFSLFGLEFGSGYAFYYIILLLVVLTTIVMRRLISSRFGLAIMSIRDDDVAAEAMGVNIVKYKIITFVISAVIAGIAGGFYAQYISFIDPSSFTYQASQEMIVMVIFGGLGSLPGCFLGAVLLTLLPELLRDLMEFRMLIYGAIMVIMMLVRPYGVLGNINFGHIRDQLLAEKHSAKEGE